MNEPTNEIKINLSILAMTITTTRQQRSEMHPNQRGMTIQITTTIIIIKDLVIIQIIMIIQTLNPIQLKERTPQDQIHQITIIDRPINLQRIIKTLATRQPSHSSMILTIHLDHTTKSASLQHPDQQTMELIISTISIQQLVVRVTFQAIFHFSIVNRL
jgi:hypothetical protein